jgi:hypothetical protein
MVSRVLRERLEQNDCCLYLNSPPMVAGMQSYLAAAGVDVAHEVGKGSLLLSSEQRHLRGGIFDADLMLHTLAEALEQALRDGYAGLWATGDMAWEFGPRRDFSRLLEYEWRLEEFFRTHLQLGGICQYHADTLPADAMRHGLIAHPTIFVNETLSLINPHYLRPESFTSEALEDPEIESVLSRLCAFSQSVS